MSAPLANRALGVATVSIDPAAFRIEDFRIFSRQHGLGGQRKGLLATFCVKLVAFDVELRFNIVAGLAPSNVSRIENAFVAPKRVRGMSGQMINSFYCGDSFMADIRDRVFSEHGTILHAVIKDAA